MTPEKYAQLLTLAARADGDALEVAVAECFGPLGLSYDGAMEKFERELIATAVWACESYAEAARRLGIHVKVLRAKRKKYGVP